MLKFKIHKSYAHFCEPIKLTLRKSFHVSNNKDAEDSRHSYSHKRLDVYLLSLSVCSMLYNDVEEILIMILNRQIISWSINHYRNRLFFSLQRFSRQIKKKKSTWTQQKFNFYKVSEKLCFFLNPRNVSWTFLYQYCEWLEKLNFF